MGNESCHGVMHRAQSAARLKDGHLTSSMIRLVLESGYVTDACTTVHNPYYTSPMPDGQGALPTALLESLFYSRPGFMEPLPARPEGSFPKGEIRGISARSFARVDRLSWDLKEGGRPVGDNALKRSGDHGVLQERVCVRPCGRMPYFP